MQHPSGAETATRGLNRGNIMLFTKALDRPRRRADLVYETVDGEQLVVDGGGHEAHVLPPFTGQVWLRCDGEHDQRSIAVALGADEAQVAGAVQELARIGVLELPDGMNRRQLLARSAVVGAGIAAVSIAVPAAAAASSVPNGGGGGGGGLVQHKVRLYTPLAADGTSDSALSVDGSTAVAYNNAAYTAYNGTDVGFYSSNSSGGDQSYANHTYVTTFTLPSDFSNASLSGTFAADNDATATVNGVAASGEAFDFNSKYPLSENNPAAFQAGTNTITFSLLNTGGPFALAYDLTLSYQSAT